MTDDNIAVVKAFLATINSGGPAAATREHCAADYRWWTPGYPEIQQDVARLSDLMMDLLDEKGFALTVLGVLAEDERVAIEAESDARLKDGTAYRNHYHFLFRVKDGKIVEIKEYNDTLHVDAVWGGRFASADA